MDRKAPIISARQFNFTIGAVLLYGFLANWLLIHHISPEAVQNAMSPILFIVAYFVCCITGFFIYTKSDKPIFSFFGYNLVVLPFGLVLNQFVNAYDPNLVRQAVWITAGATAVMMVAGSLFPAFFKSIARGLFLGLLASVLIEILSAVFLHRSFVFLDWIIAAIFCGYIGVDWSRAAKAPKTIDSAIDCAAALYMDIINLFVRILRLLKRN